MNELYVEIKFAIEQASQGELLIAQLNDVMEVEGFEEQEGFVYAYFKEEKFNEYLFNNLVSVLNVTYYKSVIKNKNWNELWEKSFSPVIIKNFVAVRADFHKHIAGVKYEIIITPKMSFGTGHHATTTLMLERLNQLNCDGKKVADFGTGTGILAILVAKMQAKEVLAIDCDDWSIANANENLRNNGCELVQLLQADHFPPGGSWDLILANINLHVILANMQSFYNNLNIGGLLIISGILQEDRSIVEASVLNYTFLPQGIQIKNNWLCMAFKKESVV